MSLYSTIVQRHSASQHIHDPTRLLSTSRPCFRGKLRISELRKNGRIWPRLRYIFRRASEIAGECFQLFFDLNLSSFGFCGEERTDFGVELPKLFDRHCLQDVMTHVLLLHLILPEGSCGSKSINTC